MATQVNVVVVFTHDLRVRLIRRGCLGGLVVQVGLFIAFEKSFQI